MKKVHPIRLAPPPFSFYYYSRDKGQPPASSFNRPINVYPTNHPILITIPTTAANTFILFTDCFISNIENDRVHQQHWMMRVAFGGNFDSPIEEALAQGIEVLDSGCGMYALFNLLTMNLLFIYLYHSLCYPYSRTCYLDTRDVWTIPEFELPWHRHFTEVSWSHQAIQLSIPSTQHNRPCAIPWQYLWLCAPTSTSPWSFSNRLGQGNNKRRMWDDFWHVSWQKAYLGDRWSLTCTKAWRLARAPGGEYYRALFYSISF